MTTPLIDVIGAFNNTTYDAINSVGCSLFTALSPKLWRLVVNKLLTTLKKVGIKAFGYSGVIIILTQGSCIEALMDEMLWALQLLKEWCISVGSLWANLDKIQCILFTRKRNLDTFKRPVFFSKTLNFSKD